MTSLFELAARLQSANAAEGLLWMVLKATLIERQKGKLTAEELDRLSELIDQARKEGR